MSISQKKQEWLERRNDYAKRKKERVSREVFRVIETGDMTDEEINKINSSMNGASFNFSAILSPDTEEGIKDVVSKVMDSALDPVGEYFDILRSRGFKQAHIRALTRKLYLLYCTDPNSDVDYSNIMYSDDMVKDVALYMVTHQGVFDNLPELD